MTRTRARSPAGARRRLPARPRRDAIPSDLAARRATEARDHLLGGDVRRGQHAPAHASRVARRPVLHPTHRSTSPRTRAARRRLDTGPLVHESGTRLQERITNLASRPRRRRTAQRDGPQGQPQRNRSRPPRAGPALAIRARRRDRSHQERDPRPGWRARRRRPRRRGTSHPPRHPGSPVAPRAAEPRWRGRPLPRDPRRLDRGRHRRSRRPDPRADPRRAAQGRAVGGRRGR